jgi:hypothetical protein
MCLENVPLEMSCIHFPKPSQGSFREENIFLFNLARDLSPLSTAQEAHEQASRVAATSDPDHDSMLGMPMDMPENSALPSPHTGSGLHGSQPPVPRTNGCSCAADGN